MEIHQDTCTLKQTLWQKRAGTLLEWVWGYDEGGDREKWVTVGHALGPANGPRGVKSTVKEIGYTVRVTPECWNGMPGWCLSWSERDGSPSPWVAVWGERGIGMSSPLGVLKLRCLLELWGREGGDELAVGYVRLVFQGTWGRNVALGSPVIQMAFKALT